MGVRVVAATTPLGDDVRTSLKLLGPAPDPKRKPTPYNSGESGDASPFDSVPGIGFDSNPNAAAIVPPAGRVTGTGAALAIDAAQNNVFRAINRAWKGASGASVEIMSGASVEMVSGASVEIMRGASAQVTSGAPSAGARYIINGLSESAQAELVRTLALIAERVEPATATGTPISRPRIGLFRPWVSSIDEGWTRWVLEQYGFELVTLRPADFRAPLRQKVDVVILAEDARIPVEGAGGGRGRGAGPGGGRGVRPEYADLVSADDLVRFDQFVRTGGTVVCLGGASTFAISQFKLPVRNVVAGLKPEEYFLRGSLVEVTTDTTHPVMAGMPEKAAVFVDGSPVFETQEGFTGRVLAKYQETGSPLLSGYLIGEKYLHGKAAALDVQVDQGHVVLLGFRPQWRGQPFGTLRVLFNAALFARPQAE
jgi:hypothetical protein